MDPKPLYPSDSFEEYCAQQKEKGLQKQYWKDLPEMWKEELEFRKELEESIERLTKNL